MPRASASPAQAAPSSVVKQVRQQLAAHSDPQRQQHAVTYFPTAMQVLGVPVPALREVAKELAKSAKSAPAAEVLALCRALISDGTMEGRQVAYELLERHRPAALALGERELDALGEGLDNWASVDSFAASVAGPAWRRGQLSDAHVLGWARSPDVFVRRLALVCTVALNMRSRGGRGDVARTLRVCRELVRDRSEFVVKAMSWALRELIPHDESALLAFIDEHRATLHSRVLREVGNKLATGKKSGRRAAAKLS
jgi:3-methyladenine DNA glycosylase AlkD